MKFTFTLIFLAVSATTFAKTNFEQPTNLKAEVISATQVKLSWSGGINDVTYKVRVKEKSETVWSEFLVIAPSTNRRVNNLKPNSTYQWEIQSCGKAKKDISENTSGESFTTFSSCQAPDAIAMVRSGLDYLIVDWEENGSSKYEVRIRASNTEEWTSYFTQNNSMRIDNLQPYTEYEVEASSYCKETDLMGSVYSSSQIFSTHSFLQTDFERVTYADNIPTKNNSPKMISGARLINTFGQIISNIKPACSNSNAIYFDLNSETPNGIYVVQIPGTEGMRCLLW